MRGLPPSLGPVRAHPRDLPEAPPPDSRDALLREAVARLSGVSDALRQTLTDRLWAEIPSRVEEFGRQDGWSATTPVVIPARFGELVLIEAAVYSVPTGSVGTLTLGDMCVPNLTGVGSLVLGKLLRGGAARTLTLDTGTGGKAAVSLFGRLLPTTGGMAP